MRNFPALAHAEHLGLTAMANDIFTFELPHTYVCVGLVGAILVTVHQNYTYDGVFVWRSG